MIDVHNRILKYSFNIKVCYEQSSKLYQPCRELFRTPCLRLAGACQ